MGFLVVLVLAVLAGALLGLLGAYLGRNWVLDSQRPRIQRLASVACERPVTLSSLSLDARCQTLLLAGSVALTPECTLYFDELRFTNLVQLARKQHPIQSIQG